MSVVVVMGTKKFCPAVSMLMNAKASNRVHRTQSVKILMEVLPVFAMMVIVRVSAAIVKRDHEQSFQHRQTKIIVFSRTP